MDADDFADVVTIVRCLMRIVRRNTEPTRRVLAGEIVAVLCSELGLDDAAVRESSRQALAQTCGQASPRD